MVFAYYSKLSGIQKAIYRNSDRIEKISLGGTDSIYEDVVILEQALKSENRRDTEAIASQLINTIARGLDAPQVTVRVLASRPVNDHEELQGLYEPVDGIRKARITVWMRTARRKKVVAFRSFLRTLLHELCHHLDYELFLFPESFHTEGFFRRESHMFRQLLKLEDPA